MDGKVVSGLGRGEQYVGMDAYQRRFRAVLGFEPFPGTLNLEVDVEEKQALEEAADERSIDSFQDDGERFSAVDAFPIVVEGEDAALLEMEITDHPPDVAEIVAPVNLRDALGLDDGDIVECRPI